jgi:hypothetical protein
MNFLFPFTRLKEAFLHLTLSLLITDVVFRQKVKGPAYKLLMFFLDN